MKLILRKANEPVSTQNNIKIELKLNKENLKLKSFVGYLKYILSSSSGLIFIKIVLKSISSSSNRSILRSRLTRPSHFRIFSDAIEGIGFKKVDRCVSTARSLLD